METTRRIKFNIKQFIEDYIFCVESGDEEGEKELLETFDRVFYSSDYGLQKSIQMYMFNSKVAREYMKLYELSTRAIYILA